MLYLKLLWMIHMLAVLRQVWATMVIGNTFGHISNWQIPKMSHDL